MGTSPTPSHHGDNQACGQACPPMNRSHSRAILSSTDSCKIDLPAMLSRSFMRRCVPSQQDVTRASGKEVAASLRRDSRRAEQRRESAAAPTRTFTNASMKDGFLRPTYTRTEKRPQEILAYKLHKGQRSATQLPLMSGARSRKYYFRKLCASPRGRATSLSVAGRVEHYVSGTHSAISRPNASSPGRSVGWLESNRSRFSPRFRRIWPPMPKSRMCGGMTFDACPSG